FTSTSGNLTGDALTLKWEYFAATLTAKLDGNVIDGTYDRARSTPMHLRLTKMWQRQVTVPGHTPSINGRWVLENVKSSKGESAWHFIVKQNGDSASAAILRVDGDTGVLSGFLRDGKFVLSHFSGLRPALLEVTPNANGTLKVVLNGKEEMVA